MKQHTMSYHRDKVIHKIKNSSLSNKDEKFYSEFNKKVKSGEMDKLLESLSVDSKTEESLNLKLNIFLLISVILTFVSGWFPMIILIWGAFTFQPSDMLLLSYRQAKGLE